jgi:CubicO group peptidase (beta-lactamase class C family)
MDWVGVAVERASGMRLSEYMQKRIFEPLDIQELSMLPPKSMKSKLVGIWHRNASDQLTPRTFPLISSITETDKLDAFQSGGAGLYGSIREYGSMSMCRLVLIRSTVLLIVDRDPHYVAAGRPLIKR